MIFLLFSPFKFCRRCPLRLYTAHPTSSPTPPSAVAQDGASTTLDTASESNSVLIFVHQSFSSYCTPIYGINLEFDLSLLKNSKIKKYRPLSIPQGEKSTCYSSKRVQISTVLTRTDSITEQWKQINVDVEYFTLSTKAGLCQVRGGLLLCTYTYKCRSIY